MRNTRAFANSVISWRQQVAALLLLFVPLAQAASLVHAEQHLFHEADEFCIAFLSVDKQPMPACAVAAPAQMVFDAPMLEMALPQQGEVPRKVYLARAPPRLAS